MDRAVRDVLAEYEARAEAESQIMAGIPLAELAPRIDEFLISIGPDTGQLLHILARSMQAKQLVEIGASYGYSTIWLADAARATGGKVHSFELSQKKVDYALERLRRLGLHEYVEFHVGDALKLLPELAGPVDLVLIDCWKSLYIPAFKLITPKLSNAAVVVADNMLHPVETRQEALKYQAYVRDNLDMDSLLLEVGSGIELTKKRTNTRSQRS
jgi:predicted O-methyltransferase YrrM